MAQTRRALTEEELALLGHSELDAEETQAPDLHDDEGYPMLVRFRERLALGDLSW